MNVARIATSHARGSSASGARKQAVFAQQLPERPPVFLRRERSASDVSTMRTQNRCEKVMLEPPNDTRFHCLEGLVFHRMPVLWQVEFREFNLVAVGKYNGAHEHVLEFTHISWPRMKQQAVESGERDIFGTFVRDRSLLLQKIAREQQDIAGTFAQRWKRECEYV